MNVDTVRIDIPTNSTVNEVKIWNVEQAGKDEYTVTYSVDQTVTEGEQSSRNTAAYTVTVHVDGDGNMVITKNPTISSMPVKSSYEPKAQETDGTMDAAITEEVTEFRLLNSYIIIDRHFCLFWKPRIFLKLAFIINDYLCYAILFFAPSNFRHCHFFNHKIFES